MVIGIVGSSIAGLTAGKILAQAGHEVTIIEKEQATGGKLASLKGGKQGDQIIDYGLSYFRAQNAPFTDFVKELQDNNLLHVWDDHISQYDGQQINKVNPNYDKDDLYVATEGMNPVIRQLSRWVDITKQEQVGGLTYIGAHRGKKRAWMMNLTDISVFEADAVIIATPAIPAYGVLQTAQDETPVRRIIRVLDEVRYHKNITLMATYPDHEVPDWKGLECNDDRIGWICNESSKRELGETTLVVRSTPNFAIENEETEEEVIKDALLERLGAILGDWARTPEWNSVKTWKYFQARNPMDDPFMELEMDDAPLALIGDYMGGNTLESSYLSGYKLAQHWLDKYSDR